MKDKIIEGLICLVITITIFGMLAGTVYLGSLGYQNEETTEVIIQDKYVKRDGETDSYMVYCDNGQTYKITDLIFKGKFNSTDLYNELQINDKYIITTTGYRNNFFSLYKNINKIEKVEEE